MVGNAVARQIAMALGLALRKAWIGTLYEDEGAAPAPVTVTDAAIGSGFGSIEIPVINGDIHMVDSD